MTRNTTTNREKGRAVFLAAIMVLSVVAMSFAFAGTAAATTSADYDPSNPFQGQTVNATGAQDLTTDLNEGNATLERVTETDDSGNVVDSAFVEELSIDDQASDNDNRVQIGTSDLEDGERYFVSASGFPSQPDRNSQTFRVNEMDVDFEFEDEQVTDAGFDATTDVGIDTPRSSYDLYIHTGGDLDQDEMEGIFQDVAGEFDGYQNVNDATADAFFDLDGDEVIFIEGVRDRSVGAPNAVEANFTDVDTGEYDFNVFEAETFAFDSASIEVRESIRDGDFADIENTPAGDLVEITLELEDTSEAFVQIGDEEAGAIDIVHVEDDSDNDEATFWVNTRTFLTDVGDGDLVYFSDDDEVTSLTYDPTDSVFTDSDMQFLDEDEDLLGAAGPDGFGDYLEELGVISDAGDDPQDAIVRPIQPFAYDVSASGNGIFIATDDGQYELDDELDRTTMRLTDPGLGDVNTWNHFEGSADDEELDELMENWGATDTIAEDDRLIIGAEMTGILGLMVNESANSWGGLEDGFEPQTLDRINNLDGEGVTFEVESEDISGQQGIELDFENADDDEILIFADMEGTLYVVVDTSASSAFTGDPVDETFEIEVEYEAGDDDRFEFTDGSSQGLDEGGPVGGEDGDPSDAAYPYFADGEENTEIATGTFSVEERTAEFDDFSDGAVVLAPEEGYTITGTTNVAAQTDADVEVSDVADSQADFIRTEDADIDTDGTFETDEFDFSDLSDDEVAEIDFRINSRTIASYDANFGGEVPDDQPFTPTASGSAPASVYVGEEVTLDVEFTNSGDETGAADWSVTVGDIELDGGDELELEPGESWTNEYTVETTEDNLGDNEWEVQYGDATDSGVTTVEEEPDDDTDDADDTDDTDDTADDDDDGQPGFGVAVALVALLSAAMLALRRRD